jgi:hypothetical protein
MAYKRWVLETAPPRPHPARMCITATFNACVLCGLSKSNPCHEYPPEAGHLSTPKPAEQWAVVQQLGHKRTAGRVTEEERFGVKLLRLDVPQADGSFVTKLVGGASIYDVTYVGELEARAVARASHQEPVHAWEMPRALPAHNLLDIPEPNEFTPPRPGVPDEDGPDDVVAEGTDLHYDGPTLPAF